MMTLSTRIPSRWRATVLGASLALSAVLALALTSMPGEARAQPAPPPQEIPAGFEPVPGGKPKTEEVNASYLVLGAYAAFALGFVGYLFHLARMQSKIAGDVQTLGARLDALERRD